MKKHPDEKNSWFEKTLIAKA